MQYETEPSVSDYWMSPCEAMQPVRDQLPDIARSDAPVVIVGEFGTSRSALARFIHHNGPRADKPLFQGLFNPRHWDGYRGALAPSPRKPWFANPMLASGGTVLVPLDYGLDVETASILLQVAERDQIRTWHGMEDVVGSNSRVISRLRDDLFVDGEIKGLGRRLSSTLIQIQVRLPPLRERMADFSTFVSILVTHWNRAYRKSVRVDSAFVDLLSGYSWPGNLHQLTGVIASFMWRTHEDEINVKDLKWAIARWKDRRSSRASDEAAYGRPSPSFGTYLRDRL